MTSCNYQTAIAAASTARTPPQPLLFTIEPYIELILMYLLMSGQTAINPATARLITTTPNIRPFDMPATFLNFGSVAKTVSIGIKAARQLHHLLKGQAFDVNCFGLVAPSVF